MPLVDGTELGHYHIQSKLGEGGMGEVYLALDTKLGRKVALKILPAELASNEDRMRRFTQEAKAAAALNHPNIAHIYEIGEHEGTSFIAMEYVDGYTLRQLIHDRQTDLAKLLRWLQHVAEGLAKAHAAGIVHRDLKPDNIMVTREGHAKILDFGLAKLIEPQSLSGQRASGGLSEVATALMQQHSTPGAVLGTVGYMSPEQAQGKVNEIDHRSDVFSFGCILYEVITGRKAFEGKDTIDSLNKIIREQPEAIATLAPNAPVDLQRIVRRCLAKDPEERYQTIKDVALEIKDVRRELQNAVGINTTVPPSSTSIAQSVASPSSLESQAAVTSLSPAATSSQPSSAEYIVEGIKGNKKILFAALSLAALAITGVAFLIYHFVLKPKPRFDRVKLARITTEGNLRSVGVSPDGKYIAYSLMADGKYSLWTKHLATGSRVQIVAPVAASGMGPHFFSHDGSYVYYYQHDEQNPQGVISQVAVLGGDSKKILTNVQSTVALSPDGSQLAFGRYLPTASQQYELWLANADGSNQRKLYAFSEPSFLSGNGIAWSPDSRLIAFDYGSEEGGEHMTIGSVSVADRVFKVLTSQRWVEVGRLAWYPDGSGMAVVAGTAGGATLQIWEVSYPGGATRRITNDLHSYGSFSLTLTADAQTLVALQEEITANIWIVPEGDTLRSRALTSRKGVYDSGCEWTPDGRIVFSSNVSGKSRVWIMNADGSEQKPLSDAADESASPIVSPDGRYIFFGSLRSKTRQLWRTDIDGSSPKQITEGTGVGYYSITPDGKWILYSLWTPGLWKVSVDGGTPVKILDAAASGAEVSPDGKLLAYDIEDPQTKRRQIVIINFPDLAPLKTFNRPVTIEGWRWAPDSRAIVHRDRRGDVSNLWRQPVDGAPATQITDFKSETIRYFSYSRDGKHLAMSRGSVTRDAVLITDEK